MTSISVTCEFDFQPDPCHEVHRISLIEWNELSYYSELRWMRHTWAQVKMTK